VKVKQQEDNDNNDNNNNNDNIKSTTNLAWMHARQPINQISQSACWLAGWE